MPRKGQRLKYRKTVWPKPPGPDPSLRDDPQRHHPLTHIMEEHFEWMLVTGYSPDTVRARRISLKRFIRWCSERGLSDAAEITLPILERYQRHLFYHRNTNGQPMTLGSQHSYLAPLKTLFKWLTREHRILYNPASELQLPKTPKHLPRTILSVQEIETILAEADPATVPGLRDRAMLEALYSTGMRRMELVGLALYDLDLTRGLVFIREGKGRRDRVIPIGARARAWIEKYLNESRPQLLIADTEALFVNDYGEAMTPEYLAGKVKRYMEFAGIHKSGACHLFRHACATHMLDNGADTRFIQVMLGHADLSTTQIYTHVSIEKLKEIHAATHPARLERVGGDNVKVAIAEAGDEPDEGAALLAALDTEAEQDEASA